MSDEAMESEIQKVGMADGLKMDEPLSPAESALLAAIIRLQSRVRSLERRQRLMESLHGTIGRGSTTPPFS